MVKRLLLLALAACSDDVVVVAPIIDSPPEGSDAAPFPDLDTIELSIALDGATADLVTATFKRGETLELTDVPYGENLVVHVIGRVGGSEVSVGRTCSFPIRPDGDMPAPHLYFARTVKWADAGIPSVPGRVGGIAMTASDGSALFLGGLDDTSAASTIDRFDPRTGAHDALATLSARQGGAAAELGDGRIVIAGGVEPATLQPSRVLELVAVEAEPDRRVETIDAGPLVAAIAPALATLSDGRIVAFGGSDGAMPLASLAEISGEGSGITLRQLRPTLAVPRSGHTATRLSNDLGAPVLIAGGTDAAGMPIGTAELYKPLVEDLATLAFPMQTPRTGHRAVRLPDGSVLIVGGRDASGTPVAQLELFSLESGFQAAAMLPATAGLIDGTVTPLPDGRVLLAGGRDATGVPVDTAFIVRLDPIGGGIDVATTDRLGAPRAGHQATLMCDGTVMLVGGTASTAPAERYNPPAAGRR